MTYITYALIAAGLFIAVTALYFILSKGLSASAVHQQLSRYAVASVLAVAPLAIAGNVVWNLPLTLIVAVSVLTMLTFPVLQFVADHRRVAEIDNRMDFAFGLYLFGFLTGGYFTFTSLLPSSHNLITTVLAALELPLIILAAFQIVYFIIYHAAVDHDGLKLVLDTDVNEVLEFLRSFSPWLMIPGVVVMIAFICTWFWLNFNDSLPFEGTMPWWRTALLGCYTLVMWVITFHGKRSPFRRSGLPNLYYEDREHARLIEGYSAGTSARRGTLNVSSPLFPPLTTSGGRTYILVIGESASRDYMHAFSPTEANEGTTPWLDSMAAQGSAMLFSNAYSCHFQTVPTLTRALTSLSQYAPGSFPSSPSVIDVANALGLRTYWFSNQGHIGANDTAVTLVAETADRAAWTSQSVNRHSYDGALPRFLEEVDPAADKLVVFHLIGSHFTYSNRYPQEEAFFKPASTSESYLSAYRNSLRYTDKVLRDIYDYASQHLNLQFMLYCSDHSDIPDRRRTPVFDDFGKLRIPMALVTAPAFEKESAEVLSSLRKNASRPFSNDLFFNLLCGLLQVSDNGVSRVLPPELDLCSPSYALTPATTRVLTGTAVVADDPRYSQSPNN